MAAEAEAGVVGAAASRARSRSCYACAVAKRSCDHGAPCTRCLRLGVACFVAADKRRRQNASTLQSSQSSHERGDAQSSENEALEGRKRPREAPVALPVAQSSSSRTSPSVDGRSEPNTSGASSLSDRLGLLASMRISHPRAVFTTLEDRIIASLTRACEADRNIIFSFPAVPLSVSFDALLRHAGADGSVRMDALQPARPHPLGVGSDPASQLTFESLLMEALASSPFPTVRIAFAPPEVVDINCTRMLSVHLAYANRAWMHAFLVPKFLPDAYRPPAGSSSIPRHVAAATLRLAAVLGVVTPMRVVKKAHSPLTMDLLERLSDDDLLTVFDDGVMIDSSAFTERGHAAAAFRQSYFRAVAECLVLRRTYHSMHACLHLEGHLPEALTAAARAGVPLAAVLPPAARVLRAHPLLQDLFAALPEVSPWHLEVDEVVNVAYDTVGVVSTMAVMYHNPRFVVGGASGFLTPAAPLSIGDDDTAGRALEQLRGEDEQEALRRVASPWSMHSVLDDPAPPVTACHVVDMPVGADVMLGQPQLIADLLDDALSVADSISVW